MLSYSLQYLVGMSFLPDEGDVELAADKKTRISIGYEVRKTASDALVSKLYVEQNCNAPPCIHSENPLVRDTTTRLTGCLPSTHALITARLLT